MRINFPLPSDAATLKDRIKNMNDEEIRAMIVQMRETRVVGSLAESHKTRRRIKEYTGVDLDGGKPKVSRGRASLRLLVEEEGGE